MTFELEVTVPAGWTAISQGKREVLGGKNGSHVRFTCDKPQEEIWLVAGPWNDTTRTVDGLETLGAPPGTGRRAGGEVPRRDRPRYVAMYSKLLGAYPYSKFALVENFWETGYGMPSFTLLGSKVIRLPFILTSSYPHEILHNWFGNGIYVDSEIAATGARG